MEQDDSIVFEDPPPRTSGGKGRSDHWVTRLAPLRDRPGQWARIRGPLLKGTATNFASLLNHGGFSSIVPGEYEATVRSLDDGYFVWARYVGNGA